MTDPHLHQPLLPPDSDSQAATGNAAPLVVVPVVVETLRVDKQTVETGRLVLHKTVHVDTQTVDVPLREELVQVQRVAVGRYVEEAPAVRYEGDTMIVPVLREEVVVTKRLLLVEELHVHKQIILTNAAQVVELRREQVNYERLPPTPAPGGPEATSANSPLS